MKFYKMQSNKKSTVIIITAFLVLAVIWLVVKYFFAGTLYWRTYNRTDVNFSFKYPSSMRVCENYGTNSVAVIDGVSHVYSESSGDFGTIQGKQYTKVKTYTALTCDNFAKTNSRYLVITDLKIETSERDIKTWIEKLPKENPIKEDELPMTGLIPANGMAEWKFISAVDSDLVANHEETSIAEVSFFAGDTTLSKQYLILSNGHVYHLNTSPIVGVGTWPITFILKTLEFK